MKSFLKLFICAVFSLILAVSAAACDVAQTDGKTSTGDTPPIETPEQSEQPTNPDDGKTDN